MICTVKGEPGVGKSRLFYESKLLAQRGCLTLETFSVPHGKAYPACDDESGAATATASDAARITHHATRAMPDAARNMLSEIYNQARDFEIPVQETTDLPVSDPYLVSPNSFVKTHKPSVKPPL
jgi:hypothetical protein